MKIVKDLFWKHWNCIPWMICGAVIMIDGDVTMFQFFCAWISVIVLLWMHPIGINKQN